jgi:hypothetical protein
LDSGDQTTLSGVVAAHDGVYSSSDAPFWVDGRPLVRTDSRPVGTITMFTCAGDDAAIGDGTPIFWDFSNSDDEVAAPDGYKRKRIEVSFCDPIYLKEGTNYFFNTLKGSYIDFYMVCPSGQYYYDRSLTPTLASGGDVVVNHYLNHHFFAGDCPMGDELNTEACADTALPINYKIWIEVTVPSGDGSSYGWGSMELYRARNILLPGEDQ